ncbi:MAG: GumC family protein, partial [Janthinobacterium lividum]
IIERYNLYGTQHMDMDDRIDMVRKDIDIRPIHSEVARAGGLPGFFIAFKADDAKTAQMVCSDITTLFTNENLKLREASAEDTTDFLKGQLNDAKRSLDEQDAKLAAFERQYLGRLPGQETANSDMLSSLNTQLEAVTQQLARAEQDKSYMQAMLTQPTMSASAPSSGSITPMPALPSPAQQENQGQLQALLNQEADLTAHYTSDYPDVIAVKRKIADLRKQMAQSSSSGSTGTAGMGSPSPTRESAGMQQLRAQLRSLDVGIEEKRREQGNIQSRIGSYQERIESSPMIEEQYKQLTRDHQTVQGFYDDLLGKMNQSKMATDLEKRQEGEQFRVMDEANLPDAPFSPKRSLFLGSGAAFGLMLGLTLAGLLEYKDTTLRSERDVWAFTKLPTLGLIGFSDEMGSRKEDGPVKPKLSLPFRKGRQVAGAQG